MLFSFSNLKSSLRIQHPRGIIVFNKIVGLQGNLSEIQLTFTYTLKNGRIEIQEINLNQFEPIAEKNLLTFFATEITEQVTFKMPLDCSELQIDSRGPELFNFEIEFTSTDEVWLTDGEGNMPDLIVTDEDARSIIEDDENRFSYPYDPTKTDLDIREDPQTIFELMRKYDNGKLIIEPDFQRKLVWKPFQASQFIESVILNFPLPPFYVNQTNDGKYIIVDGLQRTTTLHSYINDKFPLSGLEVLPQLNDKKFSDLKLMNGDYQTKIEDKKLTLYIIKPSVHPKVIYDIFNRINTNGTPLNRQEVRNCIFLGESTKLLKNLSETEIFRQAIDNGVSPTRMKDREVVLRFLAFKILDYHRDYKGDLSDFVESAMVKINKMLAKDILDLHNEFIRVMNLTFRVFDKNNFRLPVGKKRGAINTAIFESVSLCFSKYSDEYILSNKDIIRNNFTILLQNTEYLDSVRVSTNATHRVFTRFRLSEEILNQNTIK